MITLQQFYKGRNVQYANELTPEIAANAVETLARANKLLDIFYAKNKSALKRGCNSGWRPPEVNKSVANAAKKSLHMTGKAIDIEDEDEMLDKWCMTDVGRKAMLDIGLWLEHPISTPRWCHLQTVPPGSGNRVFYA